MAFLNPGVVEAARVVVRQAVETALSTALSTSANLGPDTVTIGVSSTPSVTAHTLTSSGASPTDSTTLVNGDPNSGGGNGNVSGNNNNNNNNNGGGGNSSSLLFFVALGFGVVFTNLWIIVGVKYCFRYNARNRQMRNEDGEPINMENMPRPHRRRREKKLMPIDEVNEKFPMLKYKTWVSSRAQEGLPTRGGVSAPPSRPNSIRDADGVAQELPPKERMSTDERPTTSATATATRTATEPSSDDAPETADKSQVQSPRHAPKESTSSTVAGIPRASTDSNREPEATVAHKHMSQISHDEEDEDDHIDAALPPECMGTSGDTCAICIDTLEDDDDVRGLTCGHAFHAVCIDPWLTTRRACCPLCKSDYYTPKPRSQAPEGASGATGVVHVILPGGSRSDRMNLPSRPRTALFGFGRMGRTNPSRRHPTSNGGSSVPSRQRPRTAHPPPSPGATTPAPAPTGGGLLSGLRYAFPGFRVGRAQRDQAQPDPVASGANPATTPSQLEAGVRNPQS
ncbi:hypothetical protein C8A00DRAFT_17478 [Chaetomidium leptoderma]|uniref:RING-type E3 ubiquitin transferase n=1 Tax=Chaetomidium leptoderma TaxID=669021 RepID=A0AAN6VH00_9PEZI|nr:hypothetical protein C8A00DRAFT_17478 [Chaetomidium leptoderma]